MTSLARRKGDYSGAVIGSVLLLVFLTCMGRAEVGFTFMQRTGGHKIDRSRRVTDIPLWSITKDDAIHPAMLSQLRMAESKNT